MTARTRPECGRDYHPAGRWCKDCSALYMAEFKKSVGELPTGALASGEPPYNSTLGRHPLLQCKYCGEWGQWGWDVCSLCPALQVKLESSASEFRISPPVIVKQCATTGQVIYIHLKH